MLRCRTYAEMLEVARVRLGDDAAADLDEAEAGSYNMKAVFNRLEFPPCHMRSGVPLHAPLVSAQRICKQYPSAPAMRWSWYTRVKGVRRELF